MAESPTPPRETTVVTLDETILAAVASHADQSSDPPDVIALLDGMSADGAAYATRCALGDFCASIGLGIAAVRHYGAASDSCSPSDTQALTKLGAVLGAMGDFGAAIEALDAAIALRSGDPDAFYNRALARTLWAAGAEADGEAEAAGLALEQVEQDFGAAVRLRYDPEWVREWVKARATLMPGVVAGGGGWEAWLEAEQQDGWEMFLLDVADGLVEVQGDDEGGESKVRFRGTALGLYAAWIESHEGDDVGGDGGGGGGGDEGSVGAAVVLATAAPHSAVSYARISLDCGIEEHETGALDVLHTLVRAAVGGGIPASDDDDGERGGGIEGNGGDGLGAGRQLTMDDAVDACALLLFALTAGPGRDEITARAVVEGWMDAFPGDARALTSLSDLLLGAELYEEAAAILGGVVKSNPQNYHIRTLYALALGSAGQTGKAMTNLERSRAHAVRSADGDSGAGDVEYIDSLLEMLAMVES